MSCSNFPNIPEGNSCGGFNGGGNTTGIICSRCGTTTPIKDFEQGKYCACLIEIIMAKSIVLPPPDMFTLDLTTPNLNDNKGFYEALKANKSSLMAQLEEDEMDAHITTMKLCEATGNYEKAAELQQKILENISIESIL